VTEKPRSYPPEVATALFERRDALLEERAQILKKQAHLAERDREIDRELAHIQIAGRVFGLTITLPVGQASGIEYIVGEAVRPIEESRARAIRRRTRLTPARKAAATRAGMPRISDIILDRLKAAGFATGSKAAPIQDYIEETYSTQLHDKTVGMTLFRLARDGLVRRDGHTWYITPKGLDAAGGTAAGGP
jgi:hypothetical protein